RDQGGGVPSAARRTPVAVRAGSARAAPAPLAAMLPQPGGPVAHSWRIAIRGAEHCNNGCNLRPREARRSHYSDPGGNRAMSFDISRLRRADQIVGAGAVAFFIILFFLKWYGVSSNVGAVSGLDL